MSNKSARVVKKPSIPRPLVDIQNEYSQTSFKAGNVQYQIHVYQRELTQLNQELERLNNEAAARNQLDAQAKAAEPAVETPKEA